MHVAVAEGPEEEGYDGVAEVVDGGQDGVKMGIWESW